MQERKKSKRKGHMKKTALSVVVVLALSGGPWDALAQQGPETISINAVQKAMPPVKFRHHLHQERVAKDCTVCHHTTKPGDLKPEPCSACHGKNDAIPTYKDAMHKRCQGCHAKMVSEGMNPPTKCNGCHVK